jgi:hypothetical protein
VCYSRAYQHGSPGVSLSKEALFLSLFCASFHLGRFTEFYSSADAIHMHSITYPPSNFKSGRTKSSPGPCRNHTPGPGWQSKPRVRSWFGVDKPNHAQAATEKKSWSAEQARQRRSQTNALVRGRTRRSPLPSMRKLSESLRQSLCLFLSPPHLPSCHASPSSPLLLLSRSGR